MKNIRLSDLFKTYEQNSLKQRLATESRYKERPSNNLTSFQSVWDENRRQIGLQKKKKSEYEHR